MHIKKFKAATISDALEKVKQELGEEAVIMHTGHTQVKNPATGRRMRIAEVVAAIDFEVSPPIKPEKKSSVIKKRNLKTAVRPPSQLNREVIRKKALETGGLLREEKENKKDAEIKELKEMLKQAINALNRSNSEGPRKPQGYPDPMEEINAVFNQLEIPRVMHQPLISRMLKQVNQRDISRQEVLSWLKSYTMKNIKTVTETVARERPCWQAFIGPTGVGKTTTLAKIAAIRKYVHGEKGLIISVDTYRLGAIEQLKKYGELTDIPVKSADSHGELLKIFAANRDKDFIFVDTTGRSPVMSEHINELRRLFDALPGLEAKALLCANHKSEDMKDLISLYRKLPLTSWIISKTDETRHYAPLFLPLLGYQIPVSHITNGQRVPEDIRNADKKNLFNMLFSNNIREINTRFRQETKRTQPALTAIPAHKAYMENV